MAGSYISPNRRKKRLQPAMTIMLNSLVDILTILLLFLLKSFSVSPELNVNLPNLTLPASTSDKTPETTLSIILTKDKIVINDKTIATIKDWQISGIKKEDLLIPGLYEYLKKEAEKQKYLAKLTGKKFDGKLTLLADKDMPFYILKKIMYTAGQAEFSLFKFATYKEEESKT